MPRKVKFGVDHDDNDEYDMYDEYDDDYDDYQEDSPAVQEKGVESRTKHVTIDSAVWSCPICTYDNEDDMPCCDICGVFRNPLVKSGSNSNVTAVGGICKDSGVSKMAKSLFASLPYTKKGVTIVPEKVDILAKEDNISYKPGKTKGQFHDINKAFSSQNDYKFKIGLHFVEQRTPFIDKSPIL